MLKNLIIIMLISCSITFAKLRNPWITVEGTLNLYSTETLINDPALPKKSENVEAWTKAVHDQLFDWRRHKDFDNGGKYGCKNGYYFHEGVAYQEEGVNCHDSMKILNCFGYGYCEYGAMLAGGIWDAAGLETRRWSIGNGWHAVCDVFYNNAWHYFDINEGGWRANAQGVVYGLDWVTENSTNAQSYFSNQNLQYTSKYSAAKYFFDYDRTSNASNFDNPSYLCFNSTEIGHDMSFTLRLGEKIERYWNPLNTNWYVSVKPQGTLSNSWGNGKITYEPNLKEGYADFLDGIYEFKNVVQNSDGIIANNTGAYVIFAVRIPYPIYQSTITTSGTGISNKMSFDLGRTWINYSNNAAKGKYDYLLKIELSNGGTLTSLKIETIFMLNPGSLPRLRDGVNKVTIHRYQNNETLTWIPDWSTQAKFNASIYNKTFSYGGSAGYVNKGQAAGGANKYMTLEFKAPEGGIVQNISACATIARYKNELFNPGDEAFINVGSLPNNLIQVASLMSHEHTSQETMSNMKSEYGFGDNEQVIWTQRGEINNPQNKGYCQIKYGNCPSGGMNGPKALWLRMHYYQNKLQKDFIPNLHITHRWFLRDRTTIGEKTIDIKAEDLVKGSYTYEIECPQLYPMDPNVAVIMWVDGSLPMSEVDKLPVVIPIDEKDNIKIKGNSIYQNYPNPFNPECWIPYELKGSGNVKLRIYNVLGQKVRELELGQKQVGKYITKDKAVYWDGKDSKSKEVVSGVYYYELVVDGKVVGMKKSLVLK